MVKAKSPLFSFGAIGRLGKALTVAHKRTGPVWLHRGRPAQPRTEPQLTWRTMFLMAAGLWHDLSEAERLAWEHAGTTRHMTGYSWFMSQALRPNPGIYLPLAGGVMTGAIDMDGSPITAVLDPLLDQDAATKKYHDDNLPAGPYTEGCRVYHSVNQATPTGSDYNVLFNTERWDTDGIHSTVGNTERLTCRTAGKYVISATIGFEANVTGIRSVSIHLYPANVHIQQTSSRIRADGHYRVSLTTVFALAVDDYVTVMTWQNSGGPLNIYASNNYLCEFMMQRIG